MFYKAKVKEITQDDNGKLKKTSVEYLVDAVSVTDVEVQITQEYKNVTFDWELSSVSETKVVKVLESADRADR
jgi:hypothetical protein